VAQLTLQQRQDRLRYDYSVVMKMRSPLINITAYRNPDDLEKRRNPIVSDENGHLATHYLVTYYIKTLTGPDRYSNKTSVKIDLLANGNYPYSPPACWVIDSELPWTPHFTKAHPICIDADLWHDSKGRMLLGDLLKHIAKLLNFDEIPRTPGYNGYTPEAAEYWRTKLGGRPITPNLIYPQLPMEDIANKSEGPNGPMAAGTQQAIAFFAASPKNSEQSNQPMFSPKVTSGSQENTLFRRSVKNSQPGSVSREFFSPKRQS
jgi:hypothetical protein